jgi:glycosyltransferase involved in cell wall biosynthesis
MTLHVPLFSVFARQIGGTESAVYNLVKGIHGSGAPLKLYLGGSQQYSQEFLSWCSVSKVRSTEWKGFSSEKNMRFFKECAFEFSRPPGEWALYPNYFNPGLLRRTPHRHPTAVILHDIQYKVLPQYHTTKRKRWLDFYLPKMLSRTDVPLLISESERELVACHFGEHLAAKCQILPNAIDWCRYDPVEAKVKSAQSSQRPYIMSVFHPFPHKNLETLIKSFAMFCEEDRDHNLLLVGNHGKETSVFIQSIAANHSARIKLTGFVSDAELGELYRNASLFVLPSLYEGFGMPAVEALGLGVPTLVSKTTALPEVTLGLASYIDRPTDTQQWFEAMRSQIRTPERLTPSQVRLIRQRYEPVQIGRRLVSLLHLSKGSQAALGRSKNKA